MVKKSVSKNFEVQTEPFWTEVLALTSPTTTESPIPDFDGFDPIADTFD